MTSLQHPPSLLIRDVESFLAFEANDATIREIERASAAVEIRRDDYAILLRDGSPATVVGWGVWWYGVQHGGRQSYLDAVAHADKLRNAPAWDRDAWRARSRAGAAH